jgi:hypothetical protein
VSFRPAGRWHLTPEEVEARASAVAKLYARVPLDERDLLLPGIVLEEGAAENA